MPSASRVTISAVAVCLLATPVSVLTASAQAPPVGAPAAAVEPRHEAEQNLISLPAVQPLRRFAHHVRITHRFARDLTLGGFGPGRGVWALAIAKQTRGHLFQINLTNAFGTTYGQTALGGERSNIYLGFNLARKW